MDKATFDAMKAKADRIFAEKQAQQEAERRLFSVKYENKKGVAASDHSWKGLDRLVKPLTQINNRPAEKLAKGRTKGMKKRGPGGPSI